MRFLSATTLSLLIVAMFVGLMAAYGVRTLLLQPAPQASSPPRTIHFPVASADLPANRRLVLGDVALIPLTEEQLQERGWKRLDLMGSAEQILNRTLQHPVAMGQPFATTNFYLQGNGPDYVSLLPPGYRAVSVTVPLDRGGYVSPGHTVDLLFRSRARAGSETVAPIPETTITLIENARVLAVERPQLTDTVSNGTSGGIDLRRTNIPGTTPSAPTVVLATTPSQANALQAVQGRGTISLVSRSQSETGFEVHPPATTLEEILNIDPPSPPPEPDPPFLTQVYRGSSLQINAFEENTSRGWVPIRQPANPAPPHP